MNILKEVIKGLWWVKPKEYISEVYYYIQFYTFAKEFNWTKRDMEELSFRDVHILTSIINYKNKEKEINFKKSQNNNGNWK